MDPSGKPLNDIQVYYGFSVNSSAALHVKSNVAEFPFIDGQARTMAFYHKERNLGAIQRIGFRDDAVTVTLEPNTKVAGKLVGADGDPIVNARLRFDIYNLENVIQSLPFDSYTNSKGQFEQLVLPGNYKVQMEAPPADFFLLDLNLQIQPGVPVDWGTVDAKARMDEELNSINATFRKITGNQAQAGEVVFTGMVADLYGKPVSGAEVSQRDVKVTTQADGSFAIKLPQSVVDNFPDGQPYVTVNKDGYGQIFGKINSNKRNPIILPNDEHPIEGTLIDPEGNPVVGATIKVERYTQFGLAFLIRLSNSHSKRTRHCKGFRRACSAHRNTSTL